MTDRLAHPHSLDVHGRCRYCCEDEPPEGTECPAFEGHPVSVTVPTTGYRYSPDSSRFNDWEVVAKALLLIHGETVIDQKILDAVAHREIVFLEDPWGYVVRLK